MSETAETAGHNGAESDLKLNRDYWLLYVGFFTSVFVAVCIFNLYKDLFEEVALTRAPKYVYNFVNVLFSVFMMRGYLANTSEVLHQRYFLVIHRCLFPYLIFSIWFYCAITIYGEETLRDNVLRIGYYATFAFWCFWCCFKMVHLHSGPDPFFIVMALATIYYSGELNWVSHYIWKEKKEA